MLYLIGGVPRAGKSTVRKKMLLKGVSGIGTDDLIDVFQHALPDLNIKFENKSVDNMEKLWPIVLALGDQFTRNHEDYLVESDSFDFEKVQAILSDKNIKVCFIGFKDIDIEQKLKNIRFYAKKGDWTYMHTDEEMKNYLVKYKAKSRELEKFCSENNIKYFDTSFEFEKTLDEVVEYLIST